MKKLATFAAAAALVAVLAACQQPEQPTVDEGAANTRDLTLPVSINAAMVGMIDHSADYLFALGNGEPAWK